MFQNDLGLINQLVGQQQQQHLRRQQHQRSAPIKKETEPANRAMNNGGAGAAASSSSGGQPQRISSASSSISSSTVEEADGMEALQHNNPHRRTTASPVALINNLLNRSNVGTHAQQRELNGAGRANGSGVGSHPLGHHASINGALLQGIDFAANVSQLANYAGHFTDQLDMSNLFAANNIAAGNGPFNTSAGTNYLHHQQQQQQQPSEAATSAVVGNFGHAATNLTGGSSSSSANPPQSGNTRRHRPSAGNSLKCLYCPKKIAGGQAALQAHLEDCRLVRVHECTHCGKRFKARGGLQQHNKIHINDRPYHCHYCPKRFTQKSHLDQHERIHTGLKPFICQYCGRQFRQRSQQLGHEATHVNRERHAAVGATSAAVLGGLVSAAGGYGTGERVAVTQRQQREQLAAQNASISPELNDTNSPSRALELCRTANANGGSQLLQQQQQRQQQRQLQQQPSGSQNCDATPMEIAQQQQQMASFNGLLRAVQSTDSSSNAAAVDGLLGLRGTMATSKHQQQQQLQQQSATGIELTEQQQQLQLVSTQLMNR